MCSDTQNVSYSSTTLRERLGGLRELVLLPRLGCACSHCFFCSWTQAQLSRFYLKKFFQYHFASQIALEAPPRILKDYSGGVIPLSGCFTATIQFKTIQKSLILCCAKSQVFTRNRRHLCSSSGHRRRSARMLANHCNASESRHTSTFM